MTKNPYMIHAPTIPKAKEKSFYYCSIFAYIVYILKSNVTRTVPQGIFLFNHPDTINYLAQRDHNRNLKLA